jgi:hypothetical protein
MLNTTQYEIDSKYILETSSIIIYKFKSKGLGVHETYGGNVIENTGFSLFSLTYDQTLI